MFSVHDPDPFRGLMYIHPCRCDVQRLPASPPEDLHSRSTWKLRLGHTYDGNPALKILGKMLSKAWPVPKHHIPIYHYLIRGFVELLKESKNTR